MRPICPACAKPCKRHSCVCGYESGGDPLYPIQTLEELLTEGPPVPANDVDLRAFARAVRGYVHAQRNRFSAIVWEAEQDALAPKPKKARKR